LDNDAANILLCTFYRSFPTLWLSTSTLDSRLQLANATLFRLNILTDIVRLARVLRIRNKLYAACIAPLALSSTPCAVHPTSILMLEFQGSGLNLVTVVLSRITSAVEPDIEEEEPMVGFGRGEEPRSCQFLKLIAFNLQKAITMEYE
jgi:hypothetical protein